MRGICIDSGSTLALVKDREYFLFEHGPSNFYVSKFNNAKAHCGSYQRKHFELIEDNLPEGIDPVYDPPNGAMYAAIKQPYKNYGFEVGEIYIVGPTWKDESTHFYIYDHVDFKFFGCMPKDVFEVIRPYDGEKKDKAIKPQERPKLEALINPVIKLLPIEETTEDNKAERPKKAKQVKSNIPDGQMDIFYFLEG